MRMPFFFENKRFFYCPIGERYWIVPIPGKLAVAFKNKSIDKFFINMFGLYKDWRRI